MNYIIEDHDTSELQVYYTQWKSDTGINMTAMVFDQGNTTNPIAVLFFTSTNFGYIVHVHKMECDIKTALKIAQFFGTQFNWDPS